MAIPSSSHTTMPQGMASYHVELKLDGFWAFFSTIVMSISLEYFAAKHRIGKPAPSAGDVTLTTDFDYPVLINAIVCSA